MTDLVLLDEHLDGAVAGPVLGVDRVVLDGGVQPQAVALLAVLEGAFQGSGAARGGARRPRPPRRLRRRAGVSASSSSSSASSSSAPRSARSARSRSACLGLCAFALRAASASARSRSASRAAASSSAAISASSSARRSISSGKSCAGDARRGILVADQLVLALELLDLLHRDFELMGDPRVGATLAHPGADLVELWTERLAWHGRSGRLAHGAVDRLGGSQPRRWSHLFCVNGGPRWWVTCTNGTTEVVGFVPGRDVRGASLGAQLSVALTRAWQKAVLARVV